MSRTITAWAVVNRLGQLVIVHRSQTWVEDYAATHFDGANVVELTGELPDPPHEWKVGDWMKCDGWASPARIVDINDTSVAYQWRDEEGDPAAAWSFTEALMHAVPCDPPAWFTEGGAS